MNQTPGSFPATPTLPSKAKSLLTLSLLLSLPVLGFAWSLLRPTAVEAAGDNTIEIIFTYGSEKKTWLNEVTPIFNKDVQQTVNGKRIKVTGYALGSGEITEEVMEGRKHDPKNDGSPAHLVSPASTIFIKMGNHEWKKKTKEDLFLAPKALVYSPVVIAMWKPMAEKLGWPKKKIGWSDMHEMAKGNIKWERFGYPHWDPFRFGHTHPELSNSGMASVIAEVYAHAQKTNGLTLDDVKEPGAAKFVEDIERSMAYYGDSTGFFGSKMFKSGPGYLSAAVVYENVVIESYDKKKYKPEFPVVAIYPREGSFVCDHPIAIVNRDWVTQEHRAAAEKYIAFLKHADQQRIAMKHGLRPSDESIPLVAPLVRENGINPDEPKQRLQVPTPEVMHAILKLWQQNRKKLSVILVMDTSGSMNQNDRLTNAVLAAKELINKMNVRDHFSLIPFSSEVVPPIGRLKLSLDRKEASARMDTMIAAGETALYDAIKVAYDMAQDDDHKQLMPVILVLTDGLNNRSEGKKVVNDVENEQYLKKLLRHIKPGPEKRPTPIYTIGYELNEKDPDEKTAIDALRRISVESDGLFFLSDPETITRLFREIRKRLA